MQSALHHRGPDDRGIFIAQARGTGLTSTRLAILDLSAAGHQPMTSDDGRFHIVFNGEIYNFNALREELETQGATFRSHSDTEVVLKMYERYGADCVREFEGMFAVAIWDEKEASCFLARGPLGIKPIYYYEQAGILVFASELRTVLASGLVPRELWGEALHEYFLFGAVSEPQTLVRDVVTLTPGHHLTWKQGRSRTAMYWNIHFDSEPATRSGAIATVREALTDSVRRHLVSDVPVGLFLSGGIDSTALLALMAQNRGLDIQTFSISVDDPELDEGPHARRTAEHFGTNHFEWRLDSETAKGLLNQFLDCSDQPSIDGFNTFCVSKFAREKGAKVVLSGLGGDELFGGYPSFQTVPRMVEVGRSCNLVGALRTAAGRIVERYGLSPRARRVGSLLTGRPTSAAAYWCMRGIFTPLEADALVKRYYDQSSFHRPIAFYHVPTQPTLEDEVSYLELTRYMRNQLLRDSDVMSMAWSLELRIPFVDGKLVKAIAGIPAEFRLAHGKRILVDAVPELPQWVIDHPKRGFTFPFRDWATGAWQGVFERIERESPVRLQNWYRRWCIYALESFLERNDIRSSLLADAA
jgi:asparagine synthase (glutamine-hydrolysing)